MSTRTDEVWPPFGLRPCRALVAITASLVLIFSPTVAMAADAGSDRAVTADSSVATSSISDGSGGSKLPNEVTRTNELVLDIETDGTAETAQSGDTAGTDEDPQSGATDELTGGEQAVSGAVIPATPVPFATNSVFSCSPARGNLYSVYTNGYVYHQVSNGNWEEQIAGSAGWNAAVASGQNVASFAMNEDGNRAHAVVASGGTWDMRQRGNILEKLLVYTPQTGFTAPVTFTGSASDRTLKVNGQAVSKVDSAALLSNDSGGYTYYLGTTFKAANGKLGFALFAWDMSAAEASATSLSIANPFTLRAQMVADIPYQGSGTMPNFSSLMRDGQSGLFVLLTSPTTGNTVNGYIYSATGSAIAIASATTTKEMTPLRLLQGQATIQGAYGIIGAAFDSFGYLYMATDNATQRYDLYTGQPVGPTPITGYQMSGIANCQTPPTIAVAKNAFRAQSTDQFSLSVRTPATGNQAFVGTATTTGSTDGLQPETILTPVTDATRVWSTSNPYVLIDGKYWPNFTSVTPNRYLVRETAAGTTDFAKYDSQYRCLASDTNLAVGAGTSVYQDGSEGLALPSPTSNFGAAGAAVDCRFFNKAPVDEARLTTDLKFNQQSIIDWAAPGSTPLVSSWSDLLYVEKAGQANKIRFAFDGSDWVALPVDAAVQYTLGAESPAGQLSTAYTYAYDWTRTSPSSQNVPGRQVTPSQGENWTGNVTASLQPVNLRLFFDDAVSPGGTQRDEWILSATQGSETEHPTDDPGSWEAPEPVRAGVWELEVTRTATGGSDTYAVENWSCEYKPTGSDDSVDPIPLPVTKTPNPGVPGSYFWTVEVQNGADIDCHVTMAQSRLAVLVETSNPWDLSLTPDDFEVSAIPEAAYSDLPSLVDAFGSNEVECRGTANCNVISARLGVKYTISLKRLPVYPMYLVGFQKYVPNAAEGCPPRDPTSNPTTQPSMDDKCWTTISTSETGNEITVSAAGEYEIYRFLMSTIAIPQLPQAGGSGEAFFALMGVGVLAVAAAAALVHKRRRT
ncbi:LPXTG cell wall anchor domain-containing protein [Actinomycetaceae bacterium MB13-C1-2]|nr:LPXTG cell wall anchor domain-containing protein [Actinomycetaceae bacterium MB13-C1-2]